MPIYEFDVEESGQGQIRVAVEAPDETAARDKVQAMGYAVLGLYRIRNPAEATEKPKPPPDLANPPRRVPPLVRLSNVLGDSYSQAGWIWTGFTLIFFWFFTPMIDVLGPIEFAGSVETAEGTVLESKETNTTVNDSPVYAIRYTFTAAGGARQEGVSYSLNSGPDPNTRVTVEFPAGRPGRSRIQGMGRTEFASLGVWEFVPALVLLGFLALGVVFLVIGLRRGIRANRLLATGRAAYGRLKARAQTGTIINNRPVWKLTFAFISQDGQPQEAVTKTYRPESITDEAEERLLYDPKNPSRAVLVDGLPGRVGIDNHGEFYPLAPVRAVAALIPVMLAVALHATIAYFKYFR